MKRPLKVFSAALSLVLVSQLLLLPVHAADTPNAASAKLTEWSTDEVKAYFDPTVDWNLPVQPTPSPTPTPSAGSSGSTAPVIVNHVGSGFGWDDLLLYHLIFNSPSPYSSSSWGSNHKSYHYRSNTPYVTKTYQASSFSNKSATKTPTTSSGTGSFTTNKSSSSSTKSSTSSSTGSVSSSGTSSSSKSTSTSTGSIGGKSSGFSSSSSSSSGG